MKITRKQIDEMSHVRRLNLINGITGIKPANLIGSTSKQKEPNLAIFSSVVHMGSNPPLLGFIMRPNGDVKRDTYENILQNKYFTINHVHESFIEKAHYTSAKFESDVSEFERCELTEEYINGFTAPYVGESKIKLGMKFKEEHFIKVNGTRLIIAEILEIHLPEEVLDDKGYVRLDKAFDVGIGGLNSYYNLKRITSFPYARVSETPNFNQEETISE